MDNKPYHHLPDNTFRNPEGSPVRDDKIKWSYSTFNKEKKKLDMTVPDDHVLKKEYVLKDLASKQNSDYIGWIGHATFLIKLGKTTIITDPVFSKNAGPLIFGPKRYVAPALNLNEIRVFSQLKDISPSFSPFSLTSYLRDSTLSSNSSGLTENLKTSSLSSYSYGFVIMIIINIITLYH